MNILNRARAKTMLVLLGKGMKAKSVEIPKIPSTWSPFLDTEDMWVNVDFPKEENSTNAIYLGRKGSVFPPHIHKFSDEMLTVLNPKGKIKVVTESEMRYLYYGETFVFPYGSPHAVIFEEETKVFINWHPHFESGWEGDFLEEE